MFRVLTVIGIIAVACVLVLAGAFVFLSIQGHANDDSSAKAAQEMVSAIVTTWSESAFAANASPELAQAANAAEMQKLFKMYRTLGPLKSLGKPEGEAQATVGLTGVNAVTATYRFQATFASGPATIRVRLRKIAGVWKMDSFYVNSKVFLPS